MTEREKIKVWLYTAGIRVIRTFAEVMLAAIGTDMVRFQDVDWTGALSMALTACIASILFALKSLPEYDSQVKQAGGEQEE